MLCGTRRWNLVRRAALGSWSHYCWTRALLDALGYPRQQMGFSHTSPMATQVLQHKCDQWVSADAGIVRQDSPGLPGLKPSSNSVPLVAWITRSAMDLRLVLKSIKQCEKIEIKCKWILRFLTAWVFTSIMSVQELCLIVHSPVLGLGPKAMLAPRFNPTDVSTYYYLCRVHNLMEFKAWISTTWWDAYPQIPLSQLL